MNYIEYMSSGGTADSTYYKEVPLEEKWGPKSTLTLKRNNWIKAIRDAILQAKNANAEANSVATLSSESNNVNNLPSVNTSTSRTGQYLSTLAGLAGSGMYNVINYKPRS